MTTFDIDELSQQSIDQELQTRYTLVPEGQYFGRLSEDKSDWKVRSGEADDGTPYHYLDFMCIVDKPDNEQVHERKVKGSARLDLDEQGKLEVGEDKNVQIGRLREATGQNQAGKPWNIAMLMGAPVAFTVEHNISKKDGEAYANVGRVTSREATRAA